MFEKLKDINLRPKPFEFYTADELWTNEHTSQKMLEYHLNESIDLSSRDHAFIDRSVEWMVSRFDINSDTHIVDFGCGPGLYAYRLAERGAKVTGIDFSTRSIKYAKQAAANKGLAIEYIHQNYLEYETDQKFDLIIMIFCDFCPLSPSQSKILLNKFHRFLIPDGRVLLDVSSLSAFQERQECAVYEHNLLNGFWSSDDYYGFLNTFKYEQEKVTLDKYTIIEQQRNQIVYNWLQYFSPDRLKQEFKENGFDIEDFYSNVAGDSFAPDSSEFAVVARKS